MEQTEAVLFDLDGTLVQYERSPGEVLQVAFEVAGCDPLFSVEEYYARFDEFAARHDSMDALRSACFAALAAENGYDEDCGRAVAAAFRRERDQTNVSFRPSADRVLEELEGRHRLAVVTNGAPDAQRQKIAAVDLERWVDAVVYAGDDVPTKPAPEPFERALRALDATPATAVHVGDSLETDVAGATAAGLDSVWIAEGRDAGEYAPTYRVDALDEILSLPWVERSTGDRGTD